MFPYTFRSVNNRKHVNSINKCIPSQKARFWDPFGTSHVWDNTELFRKLSWQVLVACHCSLLSCSSAGWAVRARTHGCPALHVPHRSSSLSAKETYGNTKQGYQTWWNAMTRLKKTVRRCNCMYTVINDIIYIYIIICNIITYVIGFIYIYYVIYAYTYRIQALASGDCAAHGKCKRGSCRRPR